MTLSLVLCGLYYWVWIYALPKARGYRIKQEVIGLNGGALTNRFVQVPLANLEEWDKSHDAAGYPVRKESQDETSMNSLKGKADSE
jgi:hypothetical protein